MVIANTNTDYGNCVANCKSLFADNSAALVACINGCAVVNAPKDYAVFGEASQLQAEVRKLGGREFLRKVRSAAKNAISQLPDDYEIEKLDAVSRRYVERISAVIETGLKLTDWNDAELARFAQEVSWAKLGSDIAATVMARMSSDGGGGSGPTCVTKCAQEYDQCVQENNCDTSGWVCICCVPCSLQYMGCIAKCTVGVGGLGGIVIA